MSAQRALTNFAYALLKLGVIVYLFPILWENIQNPNITGDIVMGRLLLWGIIYLVVIFIIMVIDRENFNIFGFLIVLAASVYKIIDILLSSHLNSSLALYFFILCICFYFMTKEYRTRRRISNAGF